MSKTVRIQDTGETIDSIIDIKYNTSFENNSTLCEFKTPDFSVKDILNNNTIIEIENNGTTDFIGKVKDISTDDVLTITIEEQYTELLDFDSHGRIFYQRDSGEVIKELITQDIDSKGTEILNNGTTLTDVTGTTPVFELGNFVELRPETVGTDIIFAGFPKDSTNNTTYTITFDNVQTKGDIFTYFTLKMIANNQSGSFSIKAQYIDENNYNYLWNLGEIDGINDYKLERDKASPDRTSGDLDPTDTANQNKMRIIITVKGQLIEDRAIAVDGILAKSVDIVDRENTFNSVDIPNSGRLITRKFTNTVSEAVYKILQEEQKKIKVDSNNNITLKEKGGRTAPLEITENTPVVGFDTNQNANKIYNRIAVEGDGDIYVEQKSRQSIDFFGYTNTLKKRDTSLKTRENAEQKASNLLQEYAFKDVEFTITVAPIPEAKNTETGDEISINYGGIDDTFIVKKIEKENNSYITLTIDGESINT